MSSAEETALGEQIRIEHEAGERAAKQAIKHYRKCGELLAKAKADLGYRLFGRFLSKIGIKPRSAQNYMLLAREFPKLPAEKAQRVAGLSLRDALGELARTSGRAAKLPPPAIDRALKDARRESIKVAVTRATNHETVRAAAAQPRPVPQPTAALPMPMPIEDVVEDDDEAVAMRTKEALGTFLTRINEIDYRRPPERSTTQMAGDVIDFLCRVPFTKYVPADPTEITDKDMIQAIDRYFEHAIPWIVDFAAAWREQRTGEIERAVPTEASARLVDGIVLKIWATRQERPDLAADDIRAALNHVWQLLGRGVFNWGDGE
jgi:hypothetical protein